MAPPIIKADTAPTGATRDVKRLGIFDPLENEFVDNLLHDEAAGVCIARISRCML